MACTHRKNDRIAWAARRKKDRTMGVFPNRGISVETPQAKQLRPRPRSKSSPEKLKMDAKSGPGDRKIHEKSAKFRCSTEKR